MSIFVFLFVVFIYIFPSKNITVKKKRFNSHSIQIKDEIKLENGLVKKKKQRCVVMSNTWFVLLRATYRHGTERESGLIMTIIEHVSD